MSVRKPQTCHRCGKKLSPETWVRSRPTNQYYCRELEACGKRAKRAATKAVS
jgi:hypothetical protein